jgi:hypothetical protein
MKALNPELFPNAALMCRILFEENAKPSYLNLNNVIAQFQRHMFPSLSDEQTNELLSYVMAEINKRDRQAGRKMRAMQIARAKLPAGESATEAEARQRIDEIWEAGQKVAIEDFPWD